MRLDVHLHIHHDAPIPDADLHAKVDRLVAAVLNLTRQGAAMSIELDALTAEIERNTAVDASVVALVDGLADQIDALAAQLAEGDTSAAELAEFKSKVADLTASLRSSSDAVAAAVTANTPVA